MTRLRWPAMRDEATPVAAVPGHEAAASPLSFARAGVSWVVAEGLIAVSGLGFWLAAARATSNDQVGLAAGALSLGTLTSFVTQFGLPQAALRFGGRDELGDRGFARSIFGLLALTAGVIGAIVAFVASSGGSDISDLATPIVFVSVAGGAVAVSALVGGLSLNAALGHPRAVVATAAIVALTKLALVIPLAAGYDAEGVLVAWVASMAIAIAFSLSAAFRGLRPGTRVFASLAAPARYSAAAYMADLVTYTPTHGLLGWLAPIIVLGKFSAKDAGVFYIIWSAGGIMNSLPAALSVALITSRHVPAWLRTISVGAAAAAAYLAGLALVAILGGPALRMFGPEYASRGDSLLLLLAVATPLVGLNASLQAVFRLRRQLRRMAFHGVAIGVLAIGALVFAPAGDGLNPLGLGWLGAQALGAVLGLGLIRESLKRPGVA